MNAQQLSLRDIHLPETIGWWPPAMGWWILVILILVLSTIAIWLYKRITRKTAVKTAKKILQSIKQDNSLDDKEKLVKLSELIRRVAVSLSPRKETASLTGQAWLEYLDSTVTGSPFASGAGKILAGGHYQKNLANDVDMSQLITICENWLFVQKENKK
jgi:hypothetical protein